jgi:hypothetical protein
MFAGLTALILAKIFFPDIVENISWRRTNSFYDVVTDRNALMFGVGVAIVFETVRRLLK